MFVCILSGVLTLSLISCIILSRSLDISGFDSSTGNWRDWMRWALKSLPARQAIIQIFSASVVPWQGTLLAVLNYLKMEHTASCLCNTALNRYLTAVLLPPARGCLDGGETVKLCPALKSFWKAAMWLLRFSYTTWLPKANFTKQQTGIHSQHQEKPPPAQPLPCHTELSFTTILSSLGSDFQ